MKTFPQITTTRNGSPAAILYIAEGQKKCIIGMWYGGEKYGWIPHSWTTSGRAVNDSTVSALDITL